MQQREKGKTLSIGPIPTELNCADLGTKALTKKRMMGLLYMLKMVQHGGDRVGEEEYKELEHREQMKKGLKKVMKNKDLHIGLLLMMATMDQATDSKIDEGADTDEDKGWQWMIFWLCAICGALGLTEWLRRNVIQRQFT